MRKRAGILIGTLIAITALAFGIFAGDGLYDRYGRWSAKRTVTRALEGLSRGAVPPDVALELDEINPEQAAEALRAGFEVEVVDNILQSYRSFEVAVWLADGSDLWCDLYHTPEWQLKCWRVPQPRHAV